MTETKKTTADCLIESLEELRDCLERGERVEDRFPVRKCYRAGDNILRFDVPPGETQQRPIP